MRSTAISSPASRHPGDELIAARSVGVRSREPGQPAVAVAADLAERADAAEQAHGVDRRHGALLLAAMTVRCIEPDQLGVALRIGRAFRDDGEDARREPSRPSFVLISGSVAARIDTGEAGAAALARNDRRVIAGRPRQAVHHGDRVDRHPPS